MPIPNRRPVATLVFRHVRQIRATSVVRSHPEGGNGTVAPCRGHRPSLDPPQVKENDCVPFFWGEEAALGAKLRWTTAEREGREVERNGSALAKLGGGGMTEPSQC